MPETVGEQLKRRREERKLNLEQVFQAIRINPRYLKSLEADDRAGLPSGVQGKGFLRLYASFLGLPVQQLIDQWDGRLPPELPASPPEEAVPSQGEDAASPPEPAPEMDETAASIVVQVIEAGPETKAESRLDEETHLSASEVIYREIGAQLRERRETLSLSLVDVERFTRLRQHYLYAMEDGRMEDLPSLVQGRGMLNNYARFLELDGDAILLRFAEALQTRRIEKNPAQAADARPTTGPTAPRRRLKVPSTLPRLLTPDLMIGAVVILGIIGFVVWGSAQVSALRAEQTEPTAPPIANVLALTPTTQGEITATPALVATLPPDSEVGNVAVEAPQGEVTPTELPVIGDAPLQVYVIARQRAWLRVVEDSKVAFTGRVVPGNAYPFSGKQQIELVSGDAAAIQIFFNQQDLGALGLNGQIVSFVFDANGIATPTPSASSTPTITLTPTLTATPTQSPPTPTVTPFIP